MIRFGHLHAIPIYCPILDPTHIIKAHKYDVLISRKMSKIIADISYKNKLIENFLIAYRNSWDKLLSMMKIFFID